MCVRVSALIKLAKQWSVVRVRLALQAGLCRLLLHACRACSVCVYKCVCIIWLLLLLLVVVVVLRAALSPLLVAVAVLSVGVAHWQFGCTLQAWQPRLGLHFGSLLGNLHTACAAVH